MPRPTFRLAWTADFVQPDGSPRFADVGRALLDAHPHLHATTYPQHHPEIQPDQLEGLHGAIVLTPRVTAASLAHADQLLAITRFGVGYDSVDVAACTRAGVLAIITAGAVDRSMAEATLTWMLALTHHVRMKDRLVREGRWNDRAAFMGSELRGRTLGIVGLGGIGRALVSLCQGLGMNRPLAHDPCLTPTMADDLGVTAVSLPDLLSQADFVSLHCPLTPQTRGLIGAAELARMKPTAYLINTARGGIVDEDALFNALHHQRIAGAALDCFAEEPPPSTPRLAQLDNVLLAPHAIGWTHELFRDIGQAACQSLVDLSLGVRPRGVLNPEVFDHPGFQAKWRPWC
ncbi:MAG: NAD(P)-dependent oxidoreductase [Gemmataceae bacterium]